MYSDWSRDSRVFLYSREGGVGVGLIDNILFPGKGFTIYSYIAIIPSSLLGQLRMMVIYLEAKSQLGFDGLSEGI